MARKVLLMRLLYRAEEPWDTFDKPSTVFGLGSDNNFESLIVFRTSFACDWPTFTGNITASKYSSDTSIPYSMQAATIFIASSILPSLSFGIPALSMVRPIIDALYFFASPKRFFIFSSFAFAEFIIGFDLHMLRPSSITSCFVVSIASDISVTSLMVLTSHSMASFGLSDAGPTFT